MSPTRRDFIRNAAVTGAVAATGISGNTSNAAYSQQNKQTGDEQKCPFFDQPLLCDGPGPDGNYPCD